MAQTAWAPEDTVAPARTLYASFADATLAERATGALLDYGVRAEDISLVSKSIDPAIGDRAYVDRAVRTEVIDRSGIHEQVVDRTPINEPVVGRTAAVDAAEESREPDLSAKSGLSTTTPEDAAAGAAKGAGIGLGVGALAAIASIFIPGFGLVAGGGALATAIAGAAAATAGGAIAGGVHGYLKDQGIPEESISMFAEDYHAGGAILAITVPSNNVDEATAERILSKYQGNHIGAFGPDVY